jgi:translation initiation factor 2 beta subunit (eIF-2beta)/eIF-5
LESGEISFLQIRSCDNHENLFTRSLTFAIFNKCVKCIGMRSLKNLQGLDGEALIHIPL